MYLKSHLKSVLFSNSFVTQWYVTRYQYMVGRKDDRYKHLIGRDVLVPIQGGTLRVCQSRMCWNGMIPSWWFKVTFSSPSWRSLNPLRGSLNHPKKVTLNHLELVISNVFYFHPSNWEMIQFDDRNHQLDNQIIWNYIYLNPPKHSINNSSSNPTKPITFWEWYIMEPKIYVFRRWLDTPNHPLRTWRLMPRGDCNRFFLFTHL